MSQADAGGSSSPPAQAHDYDLFRSYFIGDSLRDLVAGRTAGATSLLVLTGHGEEARADHSESLTFPSLAEGRGLDPRARTGPAMSGPPPRVTVVVPAFDEEARLVPTFDTLERWLVANEPSFEVLLVDDGSSDATAEVGERYAARHSGFEVVRLPENRGKGAAVREGLLRSRGEIVLFSDADLSTPIEELAKLEDALERGADVAIGSRALPDSNLVVRQAWVRETMGKTFNVLVRLFTGLPFRDTQCGFKLMRGEMARSLAAEMREDGFAFDVELILLANRRGATIVELPVTWRNDERSRVNAVSDPVRMLASMLRIVSRTGRYRG